MLISCAASTLVSNAISRILGRAFLLTFLAFAFLFFAWTLPAKDAAQTKEITLLYSNDFHAAVEPVTATWLVDRPKIGGALDFAAWISMLRRTEPNAFLFDSGDLYTGQSISFLTRGQALVDIWKAIGFDATCLGNHEFDYGIDGALRYVREEPFPVLSANLFRKSSGAPFAKPFAIVERNGIKIAVIGIFGPEIKFTTTISTWDTLEARDPVPILRELVPQLRKQADLIIVLAHEGLPGPMQSDAEAHPEIQRNFDTDKALVAAVPGIDVLISGHAHRGIEVPWVSPATGTIVVQTYGLSTTIGVLRLTVNVAEHRVIAHRGALVRVMDGVFSPPPNVAAVVTSWEEKAEAEGRKPIGEAAVPFTRDYNAESLIGALVTDAMLSQTGAEMAFENAGGIRGDLPRGILTRSDAISALPFMNTAVEMELSGADIRSALEQSLTLDAGMLQVAGLNATYDLSQMAGHRLVSVTVGGKPLQDDRTYKIVVSSFVAHGGDHYESFRHGKNVHDTGELLCDVLTDYARKVHTLTANPAGRMEQVVQ
ncbi:MAG TPA: bifunctional UDP-sugar hydrolase/5'-nucleotidase [Candidatus Acidoferrum sp.]|nr:bifunctional UDP-sugar hydrolase/5'-nucleotidase [Candidatus Acidoferrum sp.]